jgi:quinol monooxygenase YgiN
MINVIASIHIKEGRLSEFVEIFKSNIPNVLEEKGCIEYVPTIDVHNRPISLPLLEQLKKVHSCCRYQWHG